MWNCVKIRYSIDHWFVRHHVCFRSSIKRSSFSTVINLIPVLNSIFYVNHFCCTWSNNYNSTLNTQRKITLKHHVWIYHHLLCTTLIPIIQKLCCNHNWKATTIDINYFNSGWGKSYFIIRVTLQPLLKYNHNGNNNSNCKWIS